MGPFDVTADPLSVDELVAAVQTDADGAVVTFVGLVRDNHQGKSVVSLEYEAFPELAEREMERLGLLVAEKYGLHGIAMRHRIGNLKIGEVSVIIAAASAHRAEAFAACSEALDLLKESVPVWKKEHYEDGSLWLGQAAG